MKHLVTIAELSPDEVTGLIALATDIKSRPQAWRGALEGKTLGMIFAKSSTRTRVSFEVGMYQLGGAALFLSSRDIQLGRGEPIRDTARVLSRYVDGIMVRTFDQDDVAELAKHASVPVINGLTDHLHPCQALSDLLTIREKLGRTDGLTMAYVGDGNNMAHSLLYAAPKAGMHIAIATPDGYQVDGDVLAEASEHARAAGTSVVVTRDPAEAARGAHVVATDVWASMGQEAEQAKRERDFAAYQVDSALMALADDGAIFMHCLPAHRGEEVSEEVCDGPQSVIFDQAENRLHLQKALMVELMRGN